MTGYLIYEPWEAEKNMGFIRMFEQEGRKQGIIFSYVSAEVYRDRRPANIVLNRTRRPEVSSWCQERCGIVLHDASIVETGNDKWKTILFLLDHLEKRGTEGGLDEKWLPDTLFLPAGEKLSDSVFACVRWENGREELQQRTLEEFLEEHPAVVIKTVSGHGGTQVRQIRAVKSDCVSGYKTAGGWHRTMTDCAETALLSQIEGFCESFPGADVILQEEIACRSRDVRMYILGNRIYQGVLRRGRGDFRSNYSLGGEISAYSPTPEQRVQMEQVLQGFRGHVLGMAGMDFLLGEDGEIYFNELEEMAGCRMLYQATDMDIVGDYVRWMRRELCH